MFIGFEYVDDGNYDVDRYFTIRMWRFEFRFLVGEAKVEAEIAALRFDRPKTALEQALDDRTVMLTDSMERELFATEMAQPKFFSLSEIVGDVKAALHLAAGTASAPEMPCPETMCGHSCDEEGLHDQHRAENAGEGGADLVWRK